MMRDLLEQLAEQQPSKDAWLPITDALPDHPEIVEVGVHRADWSSRILEHNEHAHLTLVDPWRPLPDWDKPMNTTATQMEDSYRACREKMRRFGGRVRIMRMTSVDAAQSGGVEPDLVYLDGDHTLRGITMDLVAWSSVVHPPHLIGGDDAAIGGQHKGYEPTLVWPTVAYFAEVWDCPLYLLGGSQWVIDCRDRGFRVVGARDEFEDRSVRAALRLGG